MKDVVKYLIFFQVCRFYFTLRFIWINKPFENPLESFIEFTKSASKALFQLLKKLFLTPFFWRIFLKQWHSSRIQKEYKRISKKGLSQRYIRYISYNKKKESSTSHGTTKYYAECSMFQNICKICMCKFFLSKNSTLLEIWKNVSITSWWNKISNILDYFPNWVTRLFEQLQ